MKSDNTKGHEDGFITSSSSRWWSLLVLSTFIMLFSGNLLGQNSETTVTGVVVDAETEEPLIGVNVVIEGTQIGVSTNVEGEFSLSVPSLDVRLILSYIGYESKGVSLDGRTELMIEMEPQVYSADDLVVVGYGVQRRANLTGSVATVSARDVEGRALSNADQMLQGVVPGLNIQTAGMGGELNQSMSMNIRGVGSIGVGSSAEPLILIDGMEGDLRALNPNDIESITVLKDAASSAIYGSRAAFGVVMVTTKEGVSGAQQVNYNSNLRWNSPMGIPEMMDSYTFALYYNDAALNVGRGAVFPDETLTRIQDFQAGTLTETNIPHPRNPQIWAAYPFAHANTNWFDEWYKSAAFSQDHNLSVSGGSDAITYYVSGQLLDQSGLMNVAEDRLDRYNLTARVTGDVRENITLSLTNRYTRQEYDRPQQLNSLAYHNIGRRWPTNPVRNPDGNYHFASELNQMEQGGRWNELLETYVLQGSARISPLTNWDINAEMNIRVRNRNQSSVYLPASTTGPDGSAQLAPVVWASAGFSGVSEQHRREDFSNFNVYTNYLFNLNDSHRFTLMGGFSSELNKYRQFGAARDNLITPSIPVLNTATENSRATGGQYQHWATAGFFGRLNYDYRERYLLEINLRYDGSSRFLDDQRWNLFPSVSVGWDIAQENFWAFESVNQFKLRASYGELGNQNTTNWYPFFPSVPVSVNSSTWLLNGERQTISSAPPLVSDQLTWERIESSNIGFDLSVFDNKLLVSLDLYERQTKGMVGPAPTLPATLGTGVPRINNADMKSRGFEFEARWRDQIGGFQYSIRTVLSDDKQTVTNYPNPDNSINTWYSGRKVGEIWGFETEGLARTQEEMDAHLANVDQSRLGSNWQGGDIMYRDLNGDGVIDGGSGVLGDTGDRRVIGNSTPRYRFGIDFSGSYRAVDFRVFLQGVGKRDWMPNGPYFWGAVGENQWQAAGFTSHMDYWRDENSVMVQAGVADVNPDAYFPRPGFDRGANRHTQTRWLQDASYIRLKNLQIGYNLPHRLIEMANLRSMRIFVSGENLLTFTNLLDTFDPEDLGLSGWNDGKTYPLSKVYSAGIEITF